MLYSTYIIATRQRGGVVLSFLKSNLSEWYSYVGRYVGIDTNLHIPNTMMDVVPTCSNITEIFYHKVLMYRILKP